MNRINTKDIIGRAILDHYNGKEAIIQTYSSIGGWDKLPAKYLFRSFGEMPEIEQMALNMSLGKILDLGCGAGSHSLYLQNKSQQVQSIDISKGAIDVCLQRGLINASLMDIWNLKGVQFDTILALMNGTGICGSLDRIPAFLSHLKSLLAPDGQILIDSSDIIYMYEDKNGEADLSDIKGYYGEVEFLSKYLEETSESFPWLYIDFYNLQQQALHLNLHCELILRGPHYDYLARITIKK